MGAWGTEIDENDTFMDVYDEFFDLYNQGLSAAEITPELKAENQDLMDNPDDLDNFWFALAKAQWECKALEPEILLKVKGIIESGADLKVWGELGGGADDIEKRKTVLAKFLKDLSVEKSEAKPREKPDLEAVEDDSPAYHGNPKTREYPGREAVIKEDLANILKLWRWWQYGAFVTVHAYPNNACAVMGFAKAQAVKAR